MPINYAQLLRYLRQDRTLSASTAAKTIRNLKYLEKHNALEPDSFADFVYQFIESNQIDWYNKLIQAITHYWKFTGNPATPPTQHTPTEKVKEVYTNEEILSVLKLAKPAYRECLAIAAYTGCRINESRLLTAPQINLLTWTITIYATKTKAERYVPISDSVKSLVATYVKGKEDRLFEFSDTSLMYELRRCCNILNIKYRPPKCFRHSFVTRNAGKDLFALMNIVGHKKPETTLRYWKSNLEMLRKTIESDSLGYESMSDDKILSVYKQQIQALRETLKLDKRFDVTIHDDPDGTNVDVRKKKQELTQQRNKRPDKI